MDGLLARIGRDDGFGGRERRVVYPYYLGDEAVAVAGLGGDKAVLSAFLAERLPKRGDALSKIVLFYRGIRPDLREQIVLRDRLARMLHQYD
jgi:hypothetical protein